LERKPLALRNTSYARTFADSIGLFEAASELEDNTAQGEAARALAAEYLNGHVRREFNIPGVTFGGRYDGSPIIVPDGSSPPPDQANVYVPTACPGGRPPHIWIGDGKSLFDTFNFEWTLLALGPNPPGVQGFEAAARLKGIDLKVVRLAASDIASLYECALVLIRPDQIVAWRGNNDDSASEILRIATGNQQVPVAI
jgi:hypothetical protein